MLYKYRGIKEFRYFVDIILNNRLYAAPYFDLNDPMEGHYLYSSGELDSDIRELISSQKKKLRICSLSEIPDNELMWSHYAEGHRGVAVGVTIKAHSEDVVPVRYDGLRQVVISSLNNHTAREILSHKLQLWDYEKEVRVFTQGKLYVEVIVNEIILGRSMSNQDKSFIKKLISNIDRNIVIRNAADLFSY